MSLKLTIEAQNVLAQAQLEARALNHDYVGTEHLLLGLLHDSSGLSSGILQSFGLHALVIRVEIEKLVIRGPAPSPAGNLPLTPRAQKTLQYAQDSAALVQATALGSEHILLGLFREESGVAGQLLRALGINVDQLRGELLKIRFEQMKIVERAVRPLQTTVARKRKMREEFLAHLTAIYEEEQARLQNPATALQEAARRFGSSEELSRELQAALPARERREYFFERLFVWRTPESATRFSLRIAASIFLLTSLVGCFLAVPFIALFGWNYSVWVALRPGLALLVLLPMDQFLVGIFYFKMRDAIFGVFGSRKSFLAVFCFGSLIALTTAASGPLFVAISRWTFADAFGQMGALCAAGLFMPFFFYLHARLSGPTEIRDTLWACLDLNPTTEAA